MKSISQPKLALGNALLNVFYNIGNKRIDALYRGDFQKLIGKIEYELNINDEHLPKDETFYNAFRRNKCSSGLLEKLSLIFYAKIDEEVRSKFKQEYLAIAKSERLSITPYWNRFVEEYGSTPTATLHPKIVSGILQTKLDEAKNEVADPSYYLKKALTQAQEKEATLKQENNRYKLQQIANEETIKKLKSEVGDILQHSALPVEDNKKINILYHLKNFNAYQNKIDSLAHQTTEQLSQAYLLKGKGYEATLQFKKALTCYAIAQKLSPSNNECKYQTGTFLYLMARYDTALDILIPLSKKLQKSKSDRILYAKCLKSIGKICYEQDNNKIALRYFKQSLELYLLNTEKDNLSIADCYNQIGLCYKKDELLDDAIKHFDKGLHLINLNKIKNTILEPSLLSHKGLALSTKGEYINAVANFELAIQLTTNLLGETHPLNGNYLNNIGEIYRAQSKYDEAIKKYEEAINMYTKVYNECHPRVAGFLNNIGSTYDMKGDYAMAEKYHLKSLKLNHKLFGKYHSSIGSNHNNLGLVYFYTKKFTKSFNQYQKAIECYKQVYKRPHPDLARVYGNIGGCYHERKDYKLALSNYSEANKINTKYFGKNHVSVAYGQANSARVYDELGQYDKAIKLYVEASEIFSHQYGAQCTLMAHCYHNLGETWYKKGDRRKAIESYQDAIVIFEKNLGAGNEYTTKSKAALAGIVPK